MVEQVTRGMNLNESLRDSAQQIYDRSSSRLNEEQRNHIRQMITDELTHYDPKKDDLKHHTPTLWPLFISGRDYVSHSDLATMNRQGGLLHTLVRSIDTLRLVQKMDTIQDHAK